MDLALYQRVREAAAHLREYGWAVVKDVMPDAAERADLQRRFWARMERFTKGEVKASEPATRKKLELMKGILMQPSEVSHFPEVWEVRKRAVPVFAMLYGTPHLTTSFDRINVFPAPKDASKRMPTIKDWLHSDQTPLRDGAFCVQGFIDLNGTEEGDAGLVVADKSHLQHHSLLYKTWNIEAADDWTQFTPTQKTYIRQNFVVHLVTCGPGDMVLWDSRTIHSNQPFARVREQDRFVVYTCMAPLSLLPDGCWDKLLAKKVKAFEDMRMTSHWPHKTKLFAKSSRTYGKPPEELMQYDRDPAITAQPKDDPTIRSLVGYNKQAVMPADHWDTAWTGKPLFELGSGEILLMRKPELLERLGRGGGGGLKRARVINLADSEDEELESDAKRPRTE